MQNDVNQENDKLIQHISLIANMLESPGEIDAEIEDSKKNKEFSNIHSLEEEKNTNYCNPISQLDKNAFGALIYNARSELERSEIISSHFRHALMDIACQIRAHNNCATSDWMRQRALEALELADSLDDRKPKKSQLTGIRSLILYVFQAKPGPSKKNRHVNLVLLVFLFSLFKFPAVIVNNLAFMVTLESEDQNFIPQNLQENTLRALNSSDLEPPDISIVQRDSEQQGAVDSYATEPAKLATNVPHLGHTEMPSAEFSGIWPQVDVMSPPPRPEDIQPPAPPVIVPAISAPTQQALALDKIGNNPLSEAGQVRLQVRRGSIPQRYAASQCSTLLFEMQLADRPSRRDISLIKKFCG